ncbi:hypothetical protein RHMOL_Rhmol13G0148400 [Rhododendron molle]|uniref:Uncharacterized protein n=1 Tax=Rhododendron molle TaxID=49168 RepID=A0ACC0L7T6_RHOML|nr:hypothetical protein RHMOL_Rhmol13G0148400 [Rhododendron molle]
MLLEFSTTSETNNTRGSHEDDVDAKKQTLKRPRSRKKYWPRVLVEVNPKKNPKPSTTKRCTPKPSKRFSDEKRRDVVEDCLPSACTNPSKRLQVDGNEIAATYVPALDKQAISFVKRRQFNGKDSTGMTFGFTPTEVWIQSTQIEGGAANDPRCCNQNSLKVYQRKFRPNQCLSNGRKLGPNFPRRKEG